MGFQPFPVMAGLWHWYTHINVTKKSNEAHIQILDDTLLGFTSSHEIGSTGTVWVTWAAVKIRAMLACVVGQQSPTSLLVDCNVGWEFLGPPSCQARVNKPWLINGGYPGYPQKNATFQDIPEEQQEVIKKNYAAQQDTGTEPAGVLSPSAR